VVRGIREVAICQRVEVSSQRDAGFRSFGRNQFLYLQLVENTGRCLRGNESSRADDGDSRNSNTIEAFHDIHLSLENV